MITHCGKFFMLWFFLLCVIVSPELKAQKVGTTALQFLKVMPTARATAMGDAYAAIAWGVDAAFWNPGGVAGIASHEFTSTYTMWLFDTKQYALAYGLSLEDAGQVAVQFQMTDPGSFKETRVEDVQMDWNTGIFNPGLTGRTFKPVSWTMGLTYARRMTDQFSAGLTVKYVYESLWSENSITIVNELNRQEILNTFARVLLYDFGMIFSTRYRTVQIGATVQNFGPQVKFAREEFSGPMTLRLGIKGDLIGRDALLSEAQDEVLTLAYDMLQPTDYTQQMHVGLEYTFRQVVALRMGYKVNYDSDGLTLGAGAHTEIEGASVSFDYSYGAMGEYLGSVHRLTLGVKMK